MLSAEYIKQSREAFGYSQREFAELFDVTKQTILTWEQLGLKDKLKEAGFISICNSEYSRCR